MFEPTLNDDRYLPFEGYDVEGKIDTNSPKMAGSWWTVDLPAKNNGFDTTQISDVILNLRYTAEPGNGAGSDTATPVPTDTSQFQGSGSVLLKLSTEFSSAWQAARKGEGDDFVMSFAIEKAHLPYMVRQTGVKVGRLAVLVENSAANPEATSSDMSVTIKEGTKSIELPSDSGVMNEDAPIQRVLAFWEPTDVDGMFPAIQTWTLRINGTQDSSLATTLQEVYLALVLKNN